MKLLDLAREVLRRERKARVGGLDKLAAIAGVNRTTIQSIEKDLKYVPQLDTFIKLIEALPDVTVPDFWEMVQREKMKRVARDLTSESSSDKATAIGADTIRDTPDAPQATATQRGTLVGVNPISLSSDDLQTIRDLSFQSGELSLRLVARLDDILSKQSERPRASRPRSGAGSRGAHR